MWFKVLKILSFYQIRKPCHWSSGKCKKNIPFSAKFWPCHRRLCGTCNHWKMYESIMNLALGTGQCSFNEAKNICFIFWHCHRGRGNCEDWKMENKKRSCARALIQTSTWKSKIGTFYLCCKIIQDEIHFNRKVIADIDAKKL